MELTEI